jgi:hypothetical protein
LPSILLNFLSIYRQNDIFLLFWIKLNCYYCFLFNFISFIDTIRLATNSIVSNQLTSSILFLLIQIEELIMLRNARTRRF